MHKEDSGVERIPSGVPGLDRLVEGGLIKSSTTLITGGTGTGKTLFCAQFLLEGLKNGENCLFITFEEQPEDIKADVRGFGWDFDDFIKKKKLFLEYRDPFRTTDIVEPLMEMIKEHKIQRVAIDSTSILGLYFKDAFEVRKQLYKLVMALKSTGATTVLTAEITEEGHKLSRFGVEEFVVDGVIVLYFIGIGSESFSSMQIRKMRRTRHAKDIFPMEITNKGIVVKHEGSGAVMK